MKVPGGGPAEARRLSFRALDIEQIGHVYEGLLDHTAKRATEPYLGLVGTKDQEPEIPLAKLEELQAKGEKDLFKFLKDETGRSEAALKKALKAEFDAQAGQPVPLGLPGRRGAVAAGPAVRRAGAARHLRLPGRHSHGERVRHRRAPTGVRSGTHYTPRSLTEPIVQYTLEPLVYVGPAEGKPKEEWKLQLGQGTARPEDLRHGLRLGGVSGPGVPLPVRAAAGSVGGVARRQAQADQQDTLFEKKDREPDRPSASRPTAWPPRAACTSS